MFKKIKRRCANINRHFKWWLQRRQKGWDNRDLWNLDVTIAEFILPRLISFRKNLNGCPEGFTLEEFGQIIDKMIYAFDNIAHPNMFHIYDDETLEGLRLFAEYYPSLWN